MIPLRVDSLVAFRNLHPERLRLVARKRTGDLVAVEDAQPWPDNMATSFYRIVDASRSVLAHAEIPTGQSGDSFERSARCFGVHGRTSLHEVNFSTNSTCTEILHETAPTFLNPTTPESAQCQSTLDFRQPRRALTDMERQ